MTTAKKFRFWNKELKEYVKPDGLEIYPDELIAYQYDNYGTNLEIEQWTGLLDKNGKEIYEEDIIQYTMLTGEKIKRTVPTITKPLLLGYISEKTEIIGNTHTNPELAEGKEK